MKVTKVGTIRYDDSGHAQLSGWAFDAEGGNVDVSSLLSLAEDALARDLWARVKGMTADTVGIVRDPLRRFGTPTIEGTRVSPLDLIGYFADPAETPESIADDFSLTVEQVEAASRWLRERPECSRCEGMGEKRGRPCRQCGGEGRIISFEESQEAERVKEECRAHWGSCPP